MAEENKQGIYTPLGSQVEIARKDLDTEDLKYPKLYEYIHEKLVKDHVSCGLPDDIDMDMPQFLCGFLASLQCNNGYLLIKVTDELPEEVKSEVETLIEVIKDKAEEHKYYSSKDYTDYTSVYGDFDEDTVYLFECFNGDTQTYLLFPTIDFNWEVWFTGDDPTP